MAARPPFAFHFSPRQGWMNDPNGLIEHAGVHHLFFQHNPVGPVFGRMHWGHATSPDLIRWTEQPLALTPGEAGDYDVDGCWSGCTLALEDGSVSLLYSAHRDGRDLPALATSTDPDLNRWTKSPANPVVAQWPDVPELTDLRDHTVGRGGDCWRQVLAGGRDTLRRGVRSPRTPVDPTPGGLLLSYTSDGDDLAAWTYEGVLLDGRAADLPGEVWECPDVGGVEGLPAGQVLVLLSWYTRDTADPELVASDVIWLTGPLVGGSFTPTRYGRLDLGDRLYAPQSYLTSDGRRVMFGWLRTQLDPASAGRSTVGVASLPRVLTVVDGRLVQAAADEVEKLPRTPLGVLGPGRPSLEPTHPVGALELLVRTASPAELPGVVVELTAPDGHTARVSLAAFGAAATWVRNRGEWVAEGSQSARARVLVDGGLVEIFTEDGRVAASSDLALTSVARVALAQAPHGTSVAVSSIADPAVLD